MVKKKLKKKTKLNTQNATNLADLPGPICSVS